MHNYFELKKKIQQRIEILEGIIRELEQSGLVKKTETSRWAGHLDSVRDSLQESLVRVAVVGSVKSGKSTLINSLVGTDLLKRGAGIITAFITRIRSSEKREGWVELKSWSQVLDELNTAMHMLPVFQEEIGENDHWDVRRSKDRQRLKQLLEKMQTEWQQSRGQVDPNFILLNSYLEGYERLKENIGESVNRLVFEESSLNQHQSYVGEESQAVYIRDMELHYPVSWLGKELEIADCQGSDSPNPLHFALLQQYLLRSHFILYVISSRTGLREADFKLLDFIRTLRMFPQTFFVLNADLDSHPHQEDLDQLVERVRNELRWILPDPRVFAFSALYHLLEQQKDSAPERDRLRLDLWRGDLSLAQSTEKGFASFRERLADRISQQRTRVLLGSGLSRLGMVAGAISDRVHTQRGFMDQDLGNLKKSVKDLKKKQKVLRSTLGTLENAISGLRDSLRKELDEAVQRYFDLTYGPIVKDTLDIVDHYPVDSQYLKSMTDPRQLLQQLHRFYMDFRQTLSRYLVEKVNLRIIEFAKEQEVFLQERLEHSSRAFWSLFTTALDDYRRELAKIRIELHPIEDLRVPDWISPGQNTPPPFSAFVDEEALGRGRLLMKFGMGRLSGFFSGLKSRLEKWRDSSSEEPGENRNIEEAIRLVKSETRSELIFSFRDYRQNFKYMYLFKLMEEGTQRLLEEFQARAEMTQPDLDGLLKQSELEGEKRESLLDLLRRIGRIAGGMMDELEEFRSAVNPECPRDKVQASPEEKESSKREDFPSSLHENEELF